MTVGTNEPDNPKMEMPPGKSVEPPLGRSSEQPQHPVVAQRVRLHPLEVEELRDALVVGLEQLLVHLVRHRSALDLDEAVASEEGGLEGQAEHPPDPDVSGPFEERAEQRVPDAAPAQRRLDGDGPDLGQVLPEHVQRERLLVQAALADRGDDEAMHLDEDFLRALEHGLPPLGGVGLGIDRLLMALTGITSIRETVLFPLVKPQ